jgi:DoxX-like family
MKISGWIMTALVVAFLLVASAAPKFMAAQAALDSMNSIGWPTKYLTLLGILEVVLVLLFAIPRTGPLGAVLLTGLLGGTIASHLRAGSPLFGFTLFGLYLGIFIWVALYLRDARFRGFVGSYLSGTR